LCCLPLYVTTILELALKPHTTHLSSAIFPPLLLTQAFENQTPILLTMMLKFQSLNVLYRVTSYSFEPLKSDKVFVGPFLDQDLDAPDTL
jgi:hypothetical protein